MNTNHNGTGTTVPPVPDTCPGGGTDNPSSSVPVSHPSVVDWDKVDEFSLFVSEQVGRVVEALWGTLQSPNERDRNSEPANIVDGLFAIARAIDGLAEVYEEANARPEPDETPGPTVRIPDALRPPRRRRYVR